MIVKLKQAISEINQDVLSSVYLLKGNDYYIQRFFINQLSKKLFGPSQVEIVHLSSEDMTGKEIIDTITTIDLFTAKKYVLLGILKKLKAKHHQI